MKIAYLILAHDNPLHLSRLINSLASTNNFFFIHVDLKSELNVFLSLISKKNVIFIYKREYVYWGGFSIVQATINLIKKSLSLKQKFDYFILLSGSDYPIKSNHYINEFLCKKNLEHISIAEMPVKRQFENKSLVRLNRYYFETFIPSKYKLINTSGFYLKRAFNLLSGMLVKRDFKKELKGLVPYTGSQWWALSLEAISYINQFVDENKEYVNFFKHSSVPDEIFFHTIIGNSAFKSSVTKSLTFEDWKGLLHPEYINQHHIDLFKSKEKMILHDEIYGSGECLFARKFSDNSIQIIDQIDTIKKV